MAGQCCVVCHRRLRFRTRRACSDEAYLDADDSVIFNTGSYSKYALYTTLSAMVTLYLHS
jgi:hypothetical protein